MTKGIKLFRLLGIEIAIDYSWFIVFVIFGWSLSYGYFPYYYPGMPQSTYLAMGFISALLIFVCVLIHELSHSYVSNSLGLEIKRITLFIFGGVAEMSKEPEQASVEFKIAVAGPIASALLALLFYLMARVVVQTEYHIAAAMLTYLSMVNGMLCLFNLIPGFPLDGGRILRALWWGYTGDIDTATRAASRIGVGFALFLIIIGFIQIFSGNIIGGLWAVMIGFFIQKAAESGYRQLQYQQALAGVLVREIMSKDVISIAGGLTLQEAIQEYFLIHHHVSFPVLAGSKVVGIITLKKIRSLGHAKWGEISVKEAMDTLTPEMLLAPGTELLDAIRVISKGSLGRAPVIENGKVVGMLTRGDVMRVLELKTILKR